MRKLIIFSVLLTLFSSCSDWLDVNQSPNTPQETSAANRLRAMIDNSINGKCLDDLYTSYYIQYYSRTTPYFMEKLQWSTTTGVNLWRTNYWEMGTNVRYAIEDAESKEAWDYVGAIEVLSAWSWMITTDRHGDMPLKEAFTDVIAPAYDSQKEIYEYVNELLDDALVQLDKGGSENMPLSDGDLMYNGNVEKWKMFAYALKARAANHLTKKSTYNADAVISYIDQSFISNAENPEPYFESTGEGSTSDVVWSPARANINTCRPTNFLISLLNGDVFNVEDPRLRLMFNESTDGIVKGITPTVGDENSPGAASMYDKFWSSEDSKVRYASYWENQFVKAEAAFRKPDKNLALSALKEGIRAHMQYAGATTQQITDFLASEAISQSSEELTLSEIMCQKYVALFPSSTETWTDMRRMDFSSDIYVGLELPINYDPKESGNGHWPRRWLYRRYSEGDYNKPQLILVGAMDEDYTTLDSYLWKKVWWDREDDANDTETPNPQPY